jgi:hypothetical protein
VTSIDVIVLGDSDLRATGRPWRSSDRGDSWGGRDRADSGAAVVPCAISSDRSMKSHSTALDRCRPAGHGLLGSALRATGFAREVLQVAAQERVEDAPVPAPAVLDDAGVAERPEGLSGDVGREIVLIEFVRAPATASTSGVRPIRASPATGSSVGNSSPLAMRVLSAMGGCEIRR